MTKDYYNILGVGKDASGEDIKKAYRKLAHQHHPDKQGGDEAKFKEINEAYQVLSNPEKRKAYDQFGEAGVNGAGFGGGGMNWDDFARQAGFSGGFQGGVDFDLGDIFSEFFAGGGAAGVRRRGRRSRKGDDIQLDLTITFQEAAFGVKKSVELYKSVRCSTCNGNAAEPGTPIKTCEQCKGSGVVEQVQRSFFGAVRSQAPCPLCSGEGKIPEKKCHTCNGTSVEKKRVAIELNIPAGIDDGQTLRVSGQGEAGAYSAIPGDLYVSIHVRQHEGWRRKDDDVYAAIEVPYSIMTLGGKVNVATLDGDVELKIPAGTESGKLFRLKGKGVQRLHGSGRGDHYVKAEVKVPKHVGMRAKRLLKDLSDLDENY